MKIVKVYRNLKNVIDTARAEGRDEGRNRGRRQREIEIAMDLKKNGIPTEIIVETTGLSAREINDL